ncbi:unnamed protein product [Rotaria magnacalcarata]|uniref:Uncharacterized protein n=1 Tax=Rotaria magnacalcarata TaxID=392030 RepID=A0A816CM67_9BILA|nr:unnamed protein product [Rotaria magnacalcarata]CAF3848707.1 unnamed protein product [Rotaria magnacalcarata]
MDETNRNNHSDQKYYFDQLSYVLPWQRSFTSHERIIIVLIAATVVSLVACTLLCFICSQSPLRRRPNSKKKIVSRNDTLVLPSVPSNESSIQTDDKSNFNILKQYPYLYLGRESSYGTISDIDDGKLSNGINHPSSMNGNVSCSPSLNSSCSTDSSLLTIADTFPSPSYAQVNVELNFDIKKNLLVINLTNGKHFSLHPAFDEQAEFFIHVQLLNNKILKKFQDATRNRRSSLQLSTWKNQQEKTTKKLSRTTSDTLICDEHLQFALNSDSVKSVSLRFSLFCIERAGIQDVMFEATIRLDASMIPHYRQIIEFKDLPEIAFGEIFLGLSYLPTAARFTIKIEKLHYLCKKEKDQIIDARLILTFFHHGRRFFQKKLSSFIANESFTTNNNVYEINDIITQNIPQNDIQSIYVHFELVIHISNLKEESIMSCGSILLGEHTRYETVWQKMLEQPRQTHLGWYQFFG